MEHLITWSLIVALIVMFIYSCFGEGMIFGKIQNYAFNWPEWLKKPLFGCPICMAPWWGVLVLVLIGLVSGMWLPWWQWIVIVAIAGGINTVIMRI